MASIITILPDVGGVFKVIDFSDGSKRNMYLPIIGREPFTISVSRGEDMKKVIRQSLRIMVADRVEVGMSQDINFIVEEEENSPPIKIERGQDWKEAIRKGNNTFQIVSIRRGRQNISTSGFGKERVFKLAPQELVYDNTKYFEPDRDSLLKIDTNDEVASCAFQYIYQTFGKVKGYIKKARDFKTIKSLSLAEPPQFKNWVIQYQKEYNLEKLGLNSQQAVVELESFEDELFNVEVLQLNEDNWTDKEIYNSMSVLDVIRWSMWSGVSCYVIDYDGHYYLSYNHGSLSKSYTDKKKTDTRCIVLKVVNNHAYFVEDSGLKISVALTMSKYKIDDFKEVGAQQKSRGDNEYPLPPLKEKPDILNREDYSNDEEYQEMLDVEKERVEDNYKLAMEEFIADNQNKFYISPYFKVKNIIKNKRLDLYDLMGKPPTMDENDIDNWIEERSFMYYKDNPPPLPEEFLKNEPTSYYLQPRTLNGLVSHIKHNYGVSPSNMGGMYPHQLDNVCYGKTRIFSRLRNPNNLTNDMIDGLPYLFRTYPELNLKKIPTSSAIAKEIFKQEYKDKKIYSMLNSNTKRAFFDGEIKADNRVVEENPKTNLFSIDLKRAYSNALRESDVEWGIYDGLCQFEYYRGSFTPNAFYLVTEKVDEYPLRGVKGLVLYHGIFLRNILDKVDIKFIIKPVRTKSGDYFEKFVDRCQEAEDESGGIFSAKSLVNNFVGSLKKQDKISNYKIMETESNTTLTRAFFTGCVVSNLDKNTEWNKKYRMGDNKPIRLIASPIYQNYIQTGQPIRLQVIDSINERLYKLYMDYKVVFGRCPIVMTRTDALYIQDIDRTTEEIDNFCLNLYETQNIWSEKEKDIFKEDWEYKKTPNTQKPIRYKSNTWIHKITIDKPWSLTGGAKAIFNLINTGGGAMINGEAGVGKSELANYISNIFDENKKLYRWVKLIKKLTSFNAPAELEDWRDKHPCFCMKLAPTNKATNRIGGKTLNKGLGIPVLEFDEDEMDEDDDEVGYFEKKCATIIGGYSKGGEGKSYFKPCLDYMLIDEDSMINGYFWSLLLAIKHRAPRIKFILCGDIKRQLPPVGEEWRNIQGAYLLKELSNFQQINLNYNFRNGMRGNVLWDDWSLHPERFELSVNPPLTNINLCYLNNTRKQIIGIFNDILKGYGAECLSIETEGDDGISFEKDGQTEELYFTIGTPMIACKSCKDMDIYKNEMWSVSGFDKDNISLVYEDKSIQLSRREVWELFYSGYAITIHKSQGDTYKDKYSIWDWKRISKLTKFNRKLRYVAQSRSKDPENNIYYR